MKFDYTLVMSPAAGRLARRALALRERTARGFACAVLAGLLLSVTAAAALGPVNKTPSGVALEGDAPEKTTFVEAVQVQAFYLCDGYETYGDASFYDCARRFFREGARPSGEAQLEGTWHCVSAVNGPTANHEQAIKFGHHEQTAAGEGGPVDVLLVQKIVKKNPSPKRMYRTFVEASPVRFSHAAPLVGAIDRSGPDWVSTSWAYVQVARPLRLFGAQSPAHYQTRAAFRLRGDKLMIEHAAPAEARLHVWADLTADPRSTAARDRIRSKRALGEIATVADAIQLVDELVNDEIYKDGNPFRTEWTEQSLKSASTIVSYAAIEEDDTPWSFPIAYSECQRGRAP